MEGGFTSATILVSLGVILGKVSPLQLIFMILFESVIYAVNLHIGLNLLHVVDAGGTMFIHTFGAYFGVFASLAMRARNFGHPKSVENQESNYHSDHFSFVGSFLLWVYWPSFNAFATHGAGRQRALINTYLALTASTTSTLVLSPLLTKSKRFDVTGIVLSIN